MGRSAVSTAGGVAVLQGRALHSPILGGGGCDVSWKQAFRKGQGPTFPGRVSLLWKKSTQPRAVL